MTPIQHLPTHQSIHLRGFQPPRHEPHDVVLKFRRVEALSHAPRIDEPEVEGFGKEALVCGAGESVEFEFGFVGGGCGRSGDWEGAVGLEVGEVAVEEPEEEDEGGGCLKGREIEGGSCCGVFYAGGGFVVVGDLG